MGKGRLKRKNSSRDEESVGGVMEGGGLFV